MPVQGKSKEELLHSLNEALKDNTGALKLIDDNTGRSGGMLHMVCPHGIVYGLKWLIRGEGVRDHFVMILKLKTQAKCLHQ